MAPTALSAVIAGNFGAALGAAKGNLMVVLDADSHLASGEIEVDRSDLPEILDAEDLSVEVIALHGGVYLETYCWWDTNSSGAGLLWASVIS